MRCVIAAQFVGHQPVGFAALPFRQLAEEAFCCSSISAWLHEDVDHIAVVIHGTPAVMSAPLDGHEELVEVPGVARPALSSLQPPRVLGAELSALLPNGLL